MNLGWRGWKKSILRKTKMLYIVESGNENWINSKKEHGSKAKNPKNKISKLITTLIRKNNYVAFCLKNWFKILEVQTHGYRIFQKWCQKHPLKFIAYITTIRYYTTTYWLVKLMSFQERTKRHFSYQLLYSFVSISRRSFTILSKQMAIH